MTSQMRFERGSFGSICQALTHNFVHRASIVPASSWQSTDISQRPEMRPHELLDCTVGLSIPPDLEDLQEVVKPNLPWAEEHFQERVNGKPLNPPPSEKNWPYAQKVNAQFKKDGVFDHTYPERFWPRLANEGSTRPNGRQVFVPHNGIRFEYGDLWDLMEQLKRDPATRQAYLPVWFPEDTGLEVREPGARVPCTLGYHFIQRNNQLHCIYYIRSCDFMRHFRDDVYMAARLTQWIARHLGSVSPGRLTMHITSFHVFEGDLPILRREFETHT